MISSFSCNNAKRVIIGKACSLLPSKLRRVLITTTLYMKFEKLNHLTQEDLEELNQKLGLVSDSKRLKIPSVMYQCMWDGVDLPLENLCSNSHKPTTEELHRFSEWVAKRSGLLKPTDDTDNFIFDIERLFRLSSKKHNGVIPGLC